MIIPRLLFKGDLQEAVKYVGLAKKLARQAFEAGLMNKVYRVAADVTITVENAIKANICKVWIEAGTKSVYGFIFHPHSDLAVNGWWFPTEDTEEREVKITPHYPIHSFIIPSLANKWNYPYYRPNALYKNEVFTRDKFLWCGNQFFTKDKSEVKNKTYWSWWHSPHGDGPLCTNITPYKNIRLTPFLSQGYLIYQDKFSPTSYSFLAPCVFKSGQLFWSYGDLDITNYSNTITDDDKMFIGGMYPISDSRLIVVIVSNNAKTATFYDIKILSSSNWTKTALLTLTSSSLESSIRWPWRFNSTGEECATVVEVYNTSPSTYYSYEIWTISISYDDETDSYSASLSGNDSYYAKSNTVRVGTRVLDLRSGVGTAVKSISSVTSVDSSYCKLPYAVTYDANDNLKIAWYDFTGTESNLSSSSDYDVNNIPSGISTQTSTETITNILKIVIDSENFILYSYTVQLDSNSEYSLLKTDTPDDPYLECEVNNSYEQRVPNTEVMYIDINNKIVITTSSKSRTEYGYNYSVSWTLNELWGTKTVTNGYSGRVYENGRKLTLQEKGTSTILVDDTLTGPPGSSELDVSPSDVFEAGFYYLYYSVWDTSTTDLGTTFSTYLRIPQQYLSIGLGACADSKSNYVFSYDWPVETWEGQTMNRKTGNRSNIPKFNSTVVDTISGDNVLLFPLGLA